jgi:hypothetical protein
LSKQRLSPAISSALGDGASLLVPSAQRQAAVRAAWSRQQRDLGRTLWPTPRVLTFNQFCERALAEMWGAPPSPTGCCRRRRVGAAA